MAKSASEELLTGWALLLAGPPVMLATILHALELFLLPFLFLRFFFFILRIYTLFAAVCILVVILVILVICLQILSLLLLGSLLHS